MDGFGFCWGFFFGGNKESKMGYLKKKKKARKPAVGARFSWCLAQENLWILLPNCLENPREAAHLGWQHQSGFGTNGCQNMVSHQMNLTLFRMIPPLSHHLREKRCSSTPHCRAEGNNCLLLKAQNHKSKRWWGLVFFFRVNAEPRCDGTLSSARPAAVRPCQEWSGGDTALTSSPCPGHQESH